VTQQKMPDPVQLYEKAVRHTGKYFSAVKPSQHNDSTPCEKWNVKQLMEHISGGVGMVIKSYATGQLTGEDHDAAKGGITAADYEKAARRALEYVKKPGALDRKVKTPMGEMPGGQFLGILFMDNLVHGWDLAKATKQETTLPRELVEAAYSMFSPRFADLSKTPAFKPAVPVPASASTQDKLIAGLGRKP